MVKKRLELLTLCRQGERRFAFGDHKVFVADDHFSLVNVMYT